MRRGIFTVVWRSLVYYRRSVLYQMLVILMLAAVITGSLLTGESVRESLRSNNSDSIGNTGMVLSSGLRYFDSSLEERIAAASGFQSVAITELQGWAKGFGNGETALNCQIIACSDSFFKFHKPTGNISVKKGETAINRKLALDLKANIGDEIVVRFGTISSIPADSPFSSEDGSFESLVLTVSQILDEEMPANFSLEINQIKPKNIFINHDDLSEFTGGALKGNRLLIDYSKEYNRDLLISQLTDILLPSDIGLTLRQAEETGQLEIVSDRIFIDRAQVSAIEEAVPGAKPVITYLSNRISAGDSSTPYSFVSALPASLYTDAPARGAIIINRWLAEDLGVSTGDSLVLSYYISGPFNKLSEELRSFIISDIVEMEGIWGDESLMPEFPGISGSATCSRWDAGVPIEMDKIREKDEDYWNRYRGTPKAFINYEEGKEIWGNNFGPATAVRMPLSLTEEEVLKSIKGKINPLENGFTITDAHDSAEEAASNGVDFTTLFLSLGFFIIISSVILLSLIVSIAFESRKSHLKIMRSLGFDSRLIKKILLFETAFISIIGSIVGGAAGQLFNMGVIRALNSVWSGAVQTNTLTASLNIGTLITGSILTIGVSFLVLYSRAGRYLKRSVRGEDIKKRTVPSKIVKWLFIIILLILVLLPVIGLAGFGNPTTLYFSGGTLLFLASLLFYYLRIITKGDISSLLSGTRRSHSWKYYASYPSRALAPILFIAAGMFIVISTGANRKSFSSSLLTKDSGTGGYLLWGETATPLTYDLNSEAGQNEYGIAASNLEDLRFIQGRVADGDDASCLNLNQVKAPPLLGMDVREFSLKDAFSFDSRIKSLELKNPWDALDIETGENTIYGLVDQTVLQWSLKLKVGDTIVVATESGKPLNIIIAGGLSASIFQGYIIIGSSNFSKYIPSSSGSNILLVEGDATKADIYRSELSEVFSQYGIDLSFTWERLAEFNQVSNTYLTVFMTLGGFGMLLGIIGLAFVMLRNFNLREREFALLVACGQTPAQIRRTLFGEHLLILSAGIFSGTIPAIVATLPSLTSGEDIPVMLLLIMIVAITATGALSIIISSRSLVANNLVSRLRSE